MYCYLENVCSLTTSVVHVELSVRCVCVCVCVCLCVHKVTVDLYSALSSETHL